ncbi:MAG: YihY/virulence factor BrkB family protein [Polyangiaceae bacterium]|nr:YihY/virulence factor BrkB family protein [Polyangiaceae bacterium]
MMALRKFLSPRDWWDNRVVDSRAAWQDFTQHGGRLLAGALAFYALLSFAPAFYFVLRVLALVVTKGEARGALHSELSRWIGGGSSGQLIGLLDHLGEGGGHGVTSIVSAVVLLYGSTGFFSAVRRSLHQVWGIPLPPSIGFFGAVWKEVYKRAVSFAMVLVVAALLLLSLVAKTIFVKAATLVGGALAGRGFWSVMETLFTMTTLTGTLFLMFVMLPSAKINKGDALVGAIDTAILLSIGSWLIGRYLAFSDKSTMFGAAGSFVFFLLWVHYASQVFLFGVALVGARAKRLGRGLVARDLVAEVQGKIAEKRSSLRSRE